MSPSSSSWSRPTRCPGNLPDGPQTWGPPAFRSQLAVQRRGHIVKGSLIPIVASTRFPLTPFGWSGTRGPFA
jgi:hypothetical protein